MPRPVDSGGPSYPRHFRVSLVLPSVYVKTLGVRNHSFRSCTSTSGRASPLRPTGCSVYASPALFVAFSATPPRTQDSIRVGGWPLPGGDFHPARNAELVSARQRFEVSTPTVAVALRRPGRYRVEVDGEGTSTRVTVLAGEAEVASSNAVFTVHEGQVMLISGSNYNISSAGSPDAFDEWGMARDRRAEEGTRAAYHYVSPAMTGAEDLDAYGTWRVEPDYGPVWVPAVAANWAPYRFGHWVWVGPWGWTWIDEAPWGFAPSHYGRWAYIGENWAWVPGAPAPAPVYAPALVAFIGGVSLAVGVAAEPVGWCPLGPGKRYVPPYQVSNTYIQNINNTDVTHVTNVNIVKNIQVNPVNYINSNVPGGVLSGVGFL